VVDARPDLVELVADRLLVGRRRQGAVVRTATWTITRNCCWSAAVGKARRAGAGVGGRPPRFPAGHPPTRRVSVAPLKKAVETAERRNCGTDQGSRRPGSQNWPTQAPIQARVARVNGTADRQRGPHRISRLEAAEQDLARSGRRLEAASPDSEAA